MSGFVHKYNKNYLICSGVRGITNKAALILDLNEVTKGELH